MKAQRKTFIYDGKPYWDNHDFNKVCNEAMDFITSIGNLVISVQEMSGNEYFFIIWYWGGPHEPDSQ